MANAKLFIIFVQRVIEIGKTGAVIMDGHNTNAL